jgi:hypothetical protein
MPPLRNQPAALVPRDLIFLARARNGGLRVGHIVHDADQLRRRSLDVVDDPGLARLSWSPGHPSKSIALVASRARHGSPLSGRKKPGRRQCLRGHLLQPPWAWRSGRLAEGTCGRRRPARLPLAFCMLGDLVAAQSPGIPKANKVRQLAPRPDRPPVNTANVQASSQVKSVGEHHATAPAVNHEIAVRRFSNRAKNSWDAPYLRPLQGVAQGQESG